MVPLKAGTRPGVGSVEDVLDHGGRSPDRGVDRPRHRDPADSRRFRRRTCGATGRCGRLRRRTPATCSTTRPKRPRWVAEAGTGWNARRRQGRSVMPMTSCSASCHSRVSGVTGGDLRVPNPDPAPRPITFRPRGTLVVFHQESRPARAEGQRAKDPIPGRNAVPDGGRGRARARTRAGRVRPPEPAGRRCLVAAGRRSLARCVRLLPVRSVGAAQRRRRGT